MINNLYVKQVINGISWGILFLSLAWSFQSGFHFEPIIALISALAGIAFTFERNNKSLNIDNLDAKELLIYDKSDSAIFHDYIGSLIVNSEKTILIGMGLNILNNEPLRLEIMKKFASSNGILEIYMADPFGIYTERRFIEEETGEDKPSIGKKGVISKIQTLIKTWKNLDKPKNIDLKLFNNYLTFALFIIDKEYFFYPYAFAKTGNYSPVFHFTKSIKNHKKVIEFLDAQYLDIKKSAKSAVEYFNIKVDRNYAMNNNLFPVAIYFIPSVDSELYTFGSEILGYDIYSRKNIKSPIDKHIIGNAKDYGFHLTVCDALYFQNEREIREIEEELEFILEDFSSFYLEDIKLKLGFPNANTITLRCNDYSGTLSSIHFELVNRIYKKSIGSNYTFGRAKLDRPEPTLQKQKLYSNRYNAPYILDEYKPHFTLANAINPNVSSNIMNKISELFQSKVHTDKVLVNSLSILLYDDKKQQWVIKKTINLKNE